LRHFVRYSRLQTAESSGLELWKRWTQDGLFSIDYTPRSGRNISQLTTVYYKEPEGSIAWLKDIALETTTNFYSRKDVRFDDFNWNNGVEGRNLAFPMERAHRIYPKNVQSRYLFAGQSHSLRFFRWIRKYRTAVWQPIRDAVTGRFVIFSSRTDRLGEFRT